MRRQLEAGPFADRADPTAKPPALAQHPNLISRIGNKAVGRLLRETREPAIDVAVARAVDTRRAAGGTATSALVQRCGTTPPDQCPCHAEDRATMPEITQRDAAGAGGAVEALKRAERSERHPQPCLPASSVKEGFMPTVPSPLPIKLGAGTRRSPKLKRPFGPADPGCRGACGPGCPSTCENPGTYQEDYAVDGCQYTIRFPNPRYCGTHEGCRAHDAEFDVAKRRGETSVLSPEHMIGNTMAVKRWGGEKTRSWMHGGGPYDDWWWFVDQPIITASRGQTRGGPPVAFGSAAGPLFDPEAPPRREELTRPPAVHDPRRRGQGTFQIGWRF